jgi:uncharacterized peroxidase-related enzyme
VAHLDLIDPDDATGLLKEEYDAAVERAGKVFNIVRSMSLRPGVLRRSMEMYKAIMFGPSGLSRQERELLATVVSATNECHYWRRSHADDLRAEGAPDELAHNAEHDYRRAPGLDPRTRALCDYARRLTLDPASVGAADADALRSVGLDDTAIHDAIQVIAYFNYINRVAEGVGTDPEPGWEPYSYAPADRVL